jgi:hypothetical protein
MFRSIAALSIAAIVAAAGVAGLAAVLTSGVPEASAEPLVKSDRLPVVATGAACSLQGWPAYETKCQFDLRQPGNEARIVRIVGLR